MAPPFKSFRDDIKAMLLQEDDPDLTILPQQDVQKEFRPPLRVDYGTKGRDIKVRVNYFQMEVPAIDIHHYYVEVIPDVARRVNRKVIGNLQNTHSNYFVNSSAVYDGRHNMYTKNPLNIDGDHIKYDAVKIDGDQTFAVSVRRLGKINTGFLKRDAVSNKPFLAPTATHALDVILRHCSSICYTPVGKSFFSPPGSSALGIPSTGTTCQLGQGRELWFGYHQSLKHTELKMMVNVDTSTTAFYKSQPVIEFLADNLDLPVQALSQRTALSDAQRCRFAKEIRLLKVVVTHCGDIRRKYRVKAVTRRSAQTQTFPLVTENGNSIDVTVAKYFYDRYKLDLKYPHLPCLQVGDERKCTYLPLEVCDLVEGQRCPKKLSDAQTSLMIRASQKNAPAREAEILDLVDKVRICTDPIVEQYGISINPRLTEVSGRVLHPPKLVYARRFSRNPTHTDYQTCQPSGGVWDMRSKNLHRGIEIHTWAMVCFANSTVVREQDLRVFTQELQRVSNDAGMPIRGNPIFCKYATGAENVEPMFRYLLKTWPQIQIVLVILPGKTSVYGEIKKVGDTILGLATQCVAMKNVVKPATQTLSNICLKINVKVGGVNTIIQPSIRPQIFAEPVIFIGADVTHPATAVDLNQKRPTICALVGSIDAHPSRYAASVRLQTAKQEMIGDLAMMIRELMIKFRRSTGFRPLRIVMYRTGVSEGQYYNCLQHELRSIREACQSLEENYQPGVTYLIVQKRHHTRIFPTDPDDYSGRANNIPAGTVVDRDVTHPAQNEFYLCSHAGIQGTSRPSRYHVLWDDNAMTSDELQEMTYQLCHTYARCTRAVSIPAPVYYAHHVAYRARFHLMDRSQTETSYVESLYSSTASSEVVSPTFQQMNNAVKIHPDVDGLMYYA